MEDTEAEDMEEDTVVGIMEEAIMVVVSAEAASEATIIMEAVLGTISAIIITILITAWGTIISDTMATDMTMATILGSEARAAQSFSVL